MAKGKKSKLTMEDALVPVEEQPFEIPQNWCWIRFEALKNDSDSFYDGDWILGENMNPDGDVRLLQLSDIGIGEFLDKSDKHITTETFNELGCTELHVGDIMISRMAEPIARSCIVPEFDYTVITAVDVAILRCNLKYVNNKYVNYLCNVKWFTDTAMSMARGTTRTRITRANLGRIAVPLPPLAEQKRIVEQIENLFSKLDEAKEKAQAVLEGFETHKAAILHKAFSGELTTQWRQENHIGLDTWEQLYFDDCIKKMQNGIAKRSGSNGIPYVVLRLANLSDDGFNTEDLREIVLDEKEQQNYELKPNDVLMIRVNGSKENVGKQFLITNQGHWAFCDHIIRIVYRKIVLPQYMVWFSKCEEYRLYVKDNMVSSAGQNTISRKGMTRLKVPLPRVTEQAEMVRILDSLFVKEQQAKEAAETVIDQIDIMKKAILARAFRGELGTNNLGEESSVALLKQFFE